ncbi:DUF1772 domain-containing protein [Nocardia farcinica]|uniref:anthrone oxygenase family protein n=1 Tax=Nocardia farcinica TaxID=37329 RepID=UPI001892F73A|nr:anthrone oxygenase family protein [Nocardia farcinica]MBF6421758.1 DUF1772 domain-containing protein [Nocardia farcinica]MBF6433415.1 DUF1772 domain-containing protein [Nocardia farcinica]MBF6504233.1 DUF1772 domain-containing protein [Nocardia farcinica]
MVALRIAALVAAVLTTGLIAGVFYAYAISVMPALAGTDDRTIVEVMQKVNVAILNPWFLAPFVGTVACTVLAAALHLGGAQRTTLVWILVALVLDIAAFAVTAGLNVPLNERLAAAGDPAAMVDPAAVRAGFEAAWVRYNIGRAVLHTLAFLVLCGALVSAGAARAEAAPVTHPAGAVSAGV